MIWEAEKILQTTHETKTLHTHIHTNTNPATTQNDDWIATKVAKNDMLVKQS